jgi:hypothetical protein
MGCLLRYMGLLRILTNSLCTLGARPQLPHVTVSPARLIIPSGKQRLAEPGHRQLITHQMNDARALPAGHVQRDCGGHGVAR